jgi:hypothetical protein
LFYDIHKERITRRKGTGRDEKRMQNSIRELEVIDNLEDARIILKRILNIFSPCGLD